MNKFGIHGMYTGFEGLISFSYIHHKITCEVDIAVGYVVAHIYKNVGPRCLFSIMVV